MVSAYGRPKRIAMTTRERSELRASMNHCPARYTASAVRQVAARLGVAPVTPANPYWAEHGITFEDPDGFRVVLVPETWAP